MGNIEAAIEYLEMEIVIAVGNKEWSRALELIEVRETLGRLLLSPENPASGDE